MIASRRCSCAGSGAQHGAADADVLVLAWAAVGAHARAEFDLAFGEVLLELRPLLGGRLAVFGAGPHGAAPGDERAVVSDHVVLVDGNVGLCCVQVGVAEQLRRDVHRQTAGHGLRGEDAPEVVRRVAQRCVPSGPVSAARSTASLSRR
jgi:hypothetical protein